MGTYFDNQWPHFVRTIDYHSPEEAHTTNPKISIMEAQAFQVLILLDLFIQQPDREIM